MPSSAATTVTTKAMESAVCIPFRIRARLVAFIFGTVLAIKKARIKVLILALPESARACQGEVVTAGD